jgi:plastocyanin
MRSTSLIFGVLFLALGAGACSSESDPAPMTGSGGSGGGGGGGSGGSGMTAFTAVAPCNAQTDYMTGNTITFDMTGATYMPKCLKVTKGASVEFKANNGTFAHHPLKPSVKRGTATDRMVNPIKLTETGTSASFTFADAGFFPYFCAMHGFQDTGLGTMMDGVVWVTP